MARRTSSAGEPEMVTGLFRNWESAERAYQAVIARGYGKEDINLVMSDETRRKVFPADRPVRSELGSKATEGEGADPGGPMGGTLGTIGAAVGAVGTFLLLPGLGIALAGPVAVALMGAGAVAIAGGLVGALHDWGIPRERINEYELELKNGGILLGVKARSPADAEFFEQQWKTSRAEHVKS